MAIGTDELTAMRDAIADLFPDTCNILALTTTSDGAGGWTEAWGTATASVPCRVDYLSGRETTTGGALLPYQSAVISMAHGVSVTPQNRVEVGSNVYSLQAANTGQSWKAVSRFMAELVP